MKPLAKLYETTNHYRGYKIIWTGTRDTGHWEIYDLHNNWLGEAQEGQLDERINEIESEG